MRNSLYWHCFWCGKTFKKQFPREDNSVRIQADCSCGRLRALGCAWILYKSVPENNPVSDDVDKLHEAASMIRNRYCGKCKFRFICWTERGFY